MQKPKFKDAETIAIQTPIPTRVISNGEYDPIPQSADQKKVEEFILDESDKYSQKLGLSRRDFLASNAAIFLGLMGLNSIFGKFFDVQAQDILSPKKSNEDNQLIIDIQTHMIKDGFHHKSLELFAEWGIYNKVITNQAQFPNSMERYKIPNYLKEIFIDSDTRMAFLSGAPFGYEDCISNELIAQSVEAVNSIAKAPLMEGYYVVDPHREDYINEIKKFLAKGYKPIGWKLFPMGEPMATSKKPWRLDDEKLIYPLYELAQQVGITNITIHKGLIANDFEKKFPDHYSAGNVLDLKKAAEDWPKINFIIFHSALKNFKNRDQALMMKNFYKTHQIDWSTDLIKLSQKNKANNVYAELGTSFASCAVTYPEFCAAFLGQLVNEMGAEKILWGTDAVWYGSPQWQIEAFRKFRIPADMAKKMKWDISLNEKNENIRNKIFSENAIRLFDLKEKIKPKTEFKTDWIEEAKKKVSSRSNMYYGYHA